MALYALGDLHLSFSNPDKSRDKFGKAWVNHEEKAKTNISSLVKEEDTLVLTGDHSWGRDIEEAKKDLDFILSLPGKKVLLRGNHDHFWSSNKTSKLNELYNGRLFFLQNNFAVYKDYALVGTKGFTFEGPFYVNHQTNTIVGFDESQEKQSEKLINREIIRLKISLDAAKNAGYQKFIRFLHYPPTNILQQDSLFTKVAEEYHVEQVVYSHCHGENHFHDSIQGRHNGILYTFVSGDYLDFMPVKILD